MSQIHAVRLPNSYLVSEIHTSLDFSHSLYFCFVFFKVEERGYDVNQRDGENVTLLHWASINNRLDIVKYLVMKGNY